MLSVAMMDSSLKTSITSFSNRPVVGCPVKFWLINGVLLGMAVLYASFVAPCKETDTVDLSGHIKRAMAVERVDAHHSSADYGLLGTGSADTSAATPATGTPDQSAGAGASSGVHSETGAPATGTEVGNPADTTEKPTYLIYFTATWCGPCRAQKPIIEQIKDAGKFKVYIVDIDNDRSSANSWGISSVPVVATVVDGKVTYRGNGSGHSREFLESKLQGK